MVTGSKTVSSVAERLVVRYLEQCGIGPRELFGRTGISELELRDPQARISAAKHFAVARLGWQFQMPREFLSTDIADMLGACPTLVALFTNSGSLAEAYGHFFAYRGLAAETDEVSLRRDEAIFEFEYQLEGGNRSSGCAYLNFAMLASLARHYDPEDARVLSVELTGKPFARPYQLREAIGCEVRFEQVANRIRLSAPGADARNPLQNPFLYRFFLDQANAERSRIWAMRSFAQRVERFLVEEIGSGESLDPGNRLLAAACGHFDTSRWGLHRRLQTEATNFQEILSRVRAEEAKRLLARTGMSITEIGDQLGFSSLSAFSRFFSEHCGQPPSRFRDAHAGVIS
jgi:AraC-like DNA-binding protein